MEIQSHHPQHHRLRISPPCDNVVLQFISGCCNVCALKIVFFQNCLVLLCAFTYVMCTCVSFECLLMRLLPLVLCQAM